MITRSNLSARVLISVAKPSAPSSSPGFGGFASRADHRKILLRTRHDDPDRYPHFLRDNPLDPNMSSGTFGVRKNLVDGGHAQVGIDSTVF